jgi:glycerophosphoryl diester phosphodiesterase
MLDLKGEYSPGALASLVAEIEAAEMQDRVLLICFDYRILRGLRALDPTLALGYLTSVFTWLDDVAALDRAIAMPDQRALLADTTAARVWLQTAAARGIGVATWTAANEAEARTVTALGVRHFESDIPLDKGALP